METDEIVELVFPYALLFFGILVLVSPGADANAKVTMTTVMLFSLGFVFGRARRWKK